VATNFPSSLDSLTNPASGDSLSSPSHSVQHADANDAIEALQAKVGVDGSAVTTSLDYKVTNGVLSGLNVDSGVLYVDAANNRVGINNQSPAYALDVTGVANATAFIQNAADYLSPYNGFRNAIINGDFRINQRVWSSSTASATYGFDRWRAFNSGGTVTMSSQSFTVGSPAATGYEAEKFVRLVSASQSASGDYAVLQQPVEDARTFANATITISFWAKASSGTPKVAVEVAQVFGTGGSPSADVNTLGGQVTLSTSWARYSVTMSVPSISGKTFGSSLNSSTLNVNLWTSAGSTFNSRLNSLGIQNNTFDFWGVQVERGSYATPFEQRPIGTELALCQRYYFSSYGAGVAPGANLSASVPTATNALIALAVTDQFAAIFVSQVMRVAPTLTVYSIAGTSGKTSHVGSLVSTSYTDNTTKFSVATDKGWTIAMDESGSNTGWYVLCHYTASAEF